MQKFKSSPILLTTIALAIALWLPSCANQDVEQDAKMDGYEETVAEGGEAAADSGADPFLEEGKGTDEFSEAALGGDDFLTEGTQDSSGEFNDAELFGDNAGFEEFNTEETAAAPATGTPEQTPTETATTTTPPAGGDFEAFSGDDFENLAGDTALGTAGAETTAFDESLTPGENAFADVPTFSTEPTAPPAKVYAPSVVPQVAGEPFTQNGATMNRFYFVRQGDTPESVSTLIYGNSNRSTDILSWNAGTPFKAGSLVYYESPKMPGDLEMKSFYKERELVPSEVEVGRGELLSVIANEKLGAYNSWKEFAVLNNLSNPDAIAPGQKLVYYPDLGGAPEPVPVVPPADLAANAPGAGSADAAGAAAGAAVGQPGLGAPGAPDMGMEPQRQAKLPVELMEKKPRADLDRRNNPRNRPGKASSGGLSVQKLLKQNFLFITMGLGVGLLLLALLLISRRRRSAGLDEFNDDAFAAPPRKNRR